MSDYFIDKRFIDFKGLNNYKYGGGGKSGGNLAPKTDETKENLEVILRLK